MANKLIDKDGKVNTENLRKKREKQQEIFATIDSYTATLEKMPELVDVGLNFLNADSFSYSDTPMGFLIKILSVIGVSEDKLKEWITDILVKALPAVEIGVKGFLLANIKSIISCEFDPRIPWYVRKKTGDSVYIDLVRNPKAFKRGIKIGLSVIDPEGILDLSPFTEPGLNHYFGQSEDVNEDSNSKISKLARADDFNAFLWYVIHKGRQNPIAVSLESDGIFFYNGVEYIATTKYGVATSMKGVIFLTCPITKEFIVGTTFCDEGDPKEVLICIEKGDGYNVLVPLSSDWNSCNWYVDKTQYYKNNIKDNGIERDYFDEKGVCNLMYTNVGDYQGSAVVKPPVWLDYLRFTILPKPAVIIPSINKDENTKEVKANWRIVKLLFDEDGTPNSKGKYSLPGESAIKYVASDNEITKYAIEGTVVEFNTKTGEYKLDTPETGVKSLVECYPGLTVYEFNYDYIMGMRLFDAKVVCERLFQSATNSRYTFGTSINLNRQKDKSNYPFLSGKQKITEIVRKILEEDNDDDELKDCFYKFSNKEYDEMLEKTAKLKYNQSPYTEGYADGQVIDMSAAEKILLTYPKDGTIEEQKKVISMALDAACAAINKSTNNNQDKTSSPSISFLTNIFQQLALCLTDCIMSPKILMLLYVNNELMNDCGDMVTTEQLMTICKNVVTSLIKEVRDLIMQKILDYIIEFLTPLVLKMQAFIASEQFAAYMAVLRLLLSWFNAGAITLTRLNSVLSSIMSKFKSGNYEGENYEISGVLDNVNYADIFGDDFKDIAPIINNCL